MLNSRCLFNQVIHKFSYYLEDFANYAEEILKL